MAVFGGPPYSVSTSTVAAPRANTTRHSGGLTVTTGPVDPSSRRKPKARSRLATKPS